jgi:hypothetical protein
MKDAAKQISQQGQQPQQPPDGIAQDDNSLKRISITLSDTTMVGGGSPVAANK